MRESELRTRVIIKQGAEVTSRVHEEDPAVECVYFALTTKNATIDMLDKAIIVMPWRPTDATFW
jgi:hypothetical protein